MNQVRQAVAVPSSAHTTSSVRKFRAAACILLALLLTVAGARAGMDDDYMDIYSLINQADTLSANGKVSQAHAKYLQAQKALTGFQKNNPDWNTKVVSYRLMYLADKVAGTSVKAATAAPVAKEAAPPAGTTSGVKLLSAGSDPKKQLRLHPAAGDKQTITMTMKTKTGVDAAGQSMPSMEIPAIIMVMNFEVKTVSPEGEITYEMAVGDASVDTDTGASSPVAAAMKTSLAKVRGIGGAGRMDNRGTQSSMQLKLPEDADPQLRQLLDQMKESVGKSAAVLPEEAVGPGAKWEQKGPQKSGGMTFDQTANYEFVALEGDRLTLRYRLTQTAANQKLENPVMPAVKVNVDKMSGSGTGEIALDLGKAFPLSGSMELKSDLNMSVDADGRKQSMSTHTSVSMTMESK